MKIMQKLNKVLFPCEPLMRELREGHAAATAQNVEAHDRLMAACAPRNTNIFPPLKEGHIVNPR